MANSHNHITSQGYNDLQVILAGLHNSRADALEEVRRASSDKDYAENSPLEAARERLSLVDAQIAFLTSHLRGLTILDHKDREASNLGRSITIADDRAQQATYSLVSPAEANILQNKISDASPLGRSLLYKKVDDTFEVISPSGRWCGRIVAIS